LFTLARHEDSRKCLLLLRRILETPGLTDRLLEVLNPVFVQKADSPQFRRSNSSNQRRRDR
jgi:hypothetical protein